MQTRRERGMDVKLVKTTEAVGQVLCHDMTQIIRGVTKDARFRKGHIVTEEDIPVLLSMGKEHLYVWEKNEHMLHEDEAVEYLREICLGRNTSSNAPKEGKIELRAECDGMLKVNAEKLANLEKVLYGSESTEAKLPTPDEVVAIVGAGA